MLVLLYYENTVFGYKFESVKRQKIFYLNLIHRMCSNTDTWHAITVLRPLDVVDLY